MKRSSKVILLFMGTAAAGSVSMAIAPANAACEPVRSGFASPGQDEYRKRCMTRGGFGVSSHRFSGHFHSGGG